ncbi:MAG: serine/threonine protein kinase [Deltaproteobacteria bacterium]|nr:serine/threonine protein kinase [Deltaproteobacteria bacterium]
MNAGPAAESPINEVLAGRFRVEGELGQGGMARVYRATDLTTGKPMALKLLRAGVTSDGEAVARLRREGEVLTRLDHPAVVRIETFGVLEDGRLFLAMELLEGETLGARMRRGPMSPASLCPIVTGAAAGLAAAHEEGIVHRDLKPDNIFLCSLGAGKPEQVKLLDFGISKVVDYERLTRTGQILGTPRYMAPEQLSADHDLGLRVDIYAFGVILYEALAGCPPFLASSPSDLIVAVLHGKVVPLRSCRADVPPELEAIVMRAMARESSARYDSALELAAAFIDVARPRGSGVKLRAGQRTKLVGSFAPGELPDSELSDSGLRPGTFSALPQRPSAPEKTPRPAPIPQTAASPEARLERPRVVRTPPRAPRRLPCLHVPRRHRSCPTRRRPAPSSCPCRAIGRS